MKCGDERKGNWDGQTGEMKRARSSPSSVELGWRLRLGERLERIKLRTKDAAATTGKSDFEAKAKSGRTLAAP
jgi:hypothetical protein